MTQGRTHHTWPLMMGFRGTDPADEEVKQLRHFLEKGLVAGILFFAHNITSPAQLKNLTQSFLEVDTPVPPLLAIDQEGGRVQRLSAENGFRSFPSAYQIAQTFSPDKARAVYQEMACQTREAGLNYVFGPVVDLHKAVCPVIGGLERAYSDQVDIITAYAKAFIEGHRQEGVLTCLKHFPGHGLAVADTHQGWVEVTQTFDERELAPFQDLIKTGYGESLMASHVVHKGWDPCFPVSLSETIMPKRLRQEMAFYGMVVTDDLHMGAIGKHFDLETTVRQAIKAQNDLLIFSGNPLASGGQSAFDPYVKLPERLPHFVDQFLSEGSINITSIETAWRRVYTHPT